MTRELPLGGEAVVRFLPSNREGALCLELDGKHTAVDGIEVPVEDAVGLLDELDRRIEEALA